MDILTKVKYMIIPLHTMPKKAKKMDPKQAQIDLKVTYIKQQKVKNEIENFNRSVCTVWEYNNVILQLCGCRPLSFGPIMHECRSPLAFLPWTWKAAAK